MFHQRREITSDGRHIVTIGFFQPCEEQDQQLGCFGNWVNYLAACWTQRDGFNFSHVEMRFSDGFVTSVTQDKPVHYEQKMLSNPNYKAFFQVCLAPQQENKMVKMAKKFAEEKVEFNAGGMWWNFLPLLKYAPLQREGKSVFCSEYMVMLLQEAGLVEDMCPESTSPTDLYIELRTHKEFKWGMNKALFEARGGKKKILNLKSLTTLKGK